MILLTGKTFLVNLNSTIAFSVLSLIGFGICLILAGRFNLFWRLKADYMYGGMICSVQSCYINVLLAGFVQLKYVR